MASQSFLLDFGPEFIYENIISYGDYTNYKLFQQLSKGWYEMLEQPMFNQEDTKRREKDKRWFKNGLHIDEYLLDIITLDGNKRHGLFKVYFSEGFGVRSSVVGEEGLVIQDNNVWVKRYYYPSVWTGHTGEEVKSIDEYDGNNCKTKIYYSNGMLAREEEYIDSELSKATNYDYDGLLMDDDNVRLHYKMLDEQ